MMVVVVAWLARIGSLDVDGSSWPRETQDQYGCLAWDTASLLYRHLAAG